MIARLLVEATLWHKALFAELGSTAHSGSGGPSGKAAKRRAQSLIEALFATCAELGVDRLLEIGANHAETSRRFVANAPDHLAHAYEASPAVFRMATDGGLPNRLSMINKAIGTRTEMVRFYAPNDPHYAVWGSTSRREGFTDVTEIEVPMISLKTAASELPKGKIERDVALWIDVEGNTLDVINSGLEMIACRVAVIYMEVNDLNTYEGSASSITSIAALINVGFFPAARDNEFHDAWNILLIHSDYLTQSKDGFMRWAEAEAKTIELEKCK